MTNIDLANALSRIADALERNPSPVVGVNVSVQGGAGRGSVTGLKVSVTGGPGGGSVTGMRVSVSSDQNAARDMALIRELREAADAVRADKAAKSWIDGLLQRVGELGNLALNTVISAAATAATQYYLKDG